MFNTAKEEIKNYITNNPRDEWHKVIKCKDDFMSTGVISGDVPEFIQHAWVGSKENGMAPDDAITPGTIQYTELEKQLFDASQDIFNNNQFLINHQCYYIYNADGVVVYEHGNKADLDYMHNLGIKVGTDMSMSKVGLTAHGVALKFGKTAHIVGPYNYKNIFNECLLSAVPIFFQGRVVGVVEQILLDVPSEKLRSTTNRLNFLASIAISIKSFIQARQEHYSSELIRSTININMDSTSSSSGVVTINKDCNIEYICNHAKSILNYDESKELSKFVPDIKKIVSVRSKSKQASKQALTLQNGESVNALIYTLRNWLHGEVIGYSLFISEPNENKFTRYSLGNMIGEHKSIKALKEQVNNIAQTRYNVLILGGSGTGKEMIAQAVHEASGVKGPFVAINCASIPANLIESELFGYVEGAFTGAVKSGSMGKVEYANNGTLFLDEIGDMPLALQPVLLRMLEERQIMRIGAKEPTPVNVRVIAATNVKLYDKVQAREFREDLYFRLSVINLVIPPLRERGNDVVLLAQHFIDKEPSQRYNKIKLSDEAKETLLGYNWPGNIRQLENAMISAIYSLNGETVIMKHHLPPLIAHASKIVDDKPSLQLSEENTILEALKLNEWHLTNTAKMLNISRTTLYKKLREYGIKT